MNSTLYTAVLVGLTLVLVAMFGFGFYWLATKDRPAQPTTPTPSTSPASVPVDEFDEWEAYAPYPDHIVHAAQDASAESGDSYPPFGRREAFAYASPGTEARHDLHDAIESVTSAAPRAARPVPLSMGQLMTTSWTITTVSRAATHSVPRSAERLASPSRLSPLDSLSVRRSPGCMPSSFYKEQPCISFKQWPASDPNPATVPAKRSPRNNRSKSGLAPPAWTGASKKPKFDAAAVKRQLGIAVSTWDAFMVRAKVLSERKVTDSAAEAFLRRVLTYSTTNLPDRETVAVNERAIKAVGQLYAGRTTRCKTPFTVSVPNSSPAHADPR